MGLLSGKTAVIIGASSGIGWRIAQRFVEEGADVEGTNAPAEARRSLPAPKESA